MATWRDRELEVAAALEDIALLARQIGTDIREGVDDPYARVYWLRTRLGREVARLGVGQPAHQQRLTDHYEQLLQGR